MVTFGSLKIALNALKNFLSSIRMDQVWVGADYMDEGGEEPFFRGLTLI